MSPNNRPEIHERKSMNATDVTTMVAPMLDVLSKSDFGDVVSVVLDGSDPSMLASANTLRDAGARVRWYHHYFFLTLVSFV